MRVLDFQDGLYRSQPTEKIQSRTVNQPMDDTQLAQLKRMQEDAIKQSQIAESEKSKDKLVNKDKEEREKGREKKKGEKAAPEDTQKKQRRSTSDGSHLIDIDA